MSQPNTISWGWRLIALLYAATLIFIGFSAYQQTLPEYLNRIPHYDVIGHVVLYLIATYLGHRVLRQRKIPCFGYRLPLFPVIFALITVVDEFLQSFSPSRTYSWIDLTASFLGLAVGYWLVEREVGNKRE
ncbi:VanZ family protein [Spirulina sp. CS-785/01]|uniref:VanZ family protein n=1 Tax=Spirulina sp. CS-785/01 TaxID=3021716 RepID=UPI00232C0D2A|nr:VanZ family protein [Spirulina sp. CS-785/01]MDB9312219.1 VanZ family protein [Spirulina sp. CS-785/01]